MHPRLGFIRVCEALCCNPRLRDRALRASERQRKRQRTQRVASIVAAMGRAEEMPSRAVKAGDGLRHYYMSHIHDSLLQLRVKTHNLHRLEAQRNDLNSKGPSFHISVSSWPFSFLKNLSFFFLFFEILQQSETKMSLPPDAKSSNPRGSPNSSFREGEEEEDYIVGEAFSGIGDISFFEWFHYWWCIIINNSSESWILCPNWRDIVCSHFSAAGDCRFDSRLMVCLGFHSAFSAWINLKWLLTISENAKGGAADAARTRFICRGSREGHGQIQSSCQGMLGSFASYLCDLSSSKNIILGR